VQRRPWAAVPSRHLFGPDENWHGEIPPVLRRAVHATPSHRGAQSGKAYAPPPASTELDFVAGEPWRLPGLKFPREHRRPATVASNAAIRGNVCRGTERVSLASLVRLFSTLKIWRIGTPERRTGMTIPSGPCKAATTRPSRPDCVNRRFNSLWRGFQGRNHPEHVVGITHSRHTRHRAHQRPQSSTTPQLQATTPALEQWQRRKLFTSSPA
jgi:hypothetical protein